ncbi:MAG: helix-turn-helix transcriptional regulator [bacterium]|nr:helix-turn-helix transcriptional regulator [Candidatus Colisoma equi]
MPLEKDSFRIVEPKDVLRTLGGLMRLLRQREELTLEELAGKSGVPASTISRLERTGLASTDSLFRIAFALDQIDVVETFLNERMRLLRFPKTLSGNAGPFRDVVRVRHRKGERR